MEPQDERVVAVGRQEAGGQREDLREPALPEPDEVEALEHDDIPGPGVEMLLHLLLGRTRTAADQERDGLDVASLAGRVASTRRRAPSPPPPVPVRSAPRETGRWTPRRGPAPDRDPAGRPPGTHPGRRGPSRAGRAPLRRNRPARRWSPSWRGARTRRCASWRGAERGQARADGPGRVHGTIGSGLFRDPARPGRPSQAPATRFRIICTVPPAIVNMRASRTIRSSGRSRG